MRISRRRTFLVWTLLGVGLLPTLAHGDGAALQKYHPWGCFNEGSWSKVRVTTETFDEKGRLTSVGSMETKTTLQLVDADGVTLQVENTVEVAGKRLASQPQTIKQGYSGEQVGQNVAVKNLPATQVIIDGKQIPCEVQQVEILAEGRKRVTLIHYSDAITPHILRRKSTLSDLSSQAAATNETSVEVLSLDMPVKVLDEIRPAAYLQIVQKNDHGKTITFSASAPDVPGEVVWHSSKSLDTHGRLVRRSTLEVAGYYVAPESTDGGRFRQRRRERMQTR